MDAQVNRYMLSVLGILSSILRDEINQSREWGEDFGVDYQDSSDARVRA
jgi:hypothetical protein